MKREGTQIATNRRKNKLTFLKIKIIIEKSRRKEEKSMDFPYSVNDITTNFNISKTTFYNQAKKNQEFFNKNSIKERPQGKNTKPIFKYNQSVYDFFASQYGGGEGNEVLENIDLVEDACVERLRKQSVSNAPETPPEAPETISEGKEGETLTQEKINALQAKIEALEAKLEAAEAERRDLIAQNGNLLLLLNQLNQEKQALLPAPRKTIGERIKGLFRK